MKSLYLNETLHGRLKFLATFEGKSLSQLVEEFLTREMERKLADLPAETLAKLATMGESFDFLTRPEEDIYSDKDGAPIR
jgi:hypothetical protein